MKKQHFDFPGPTQGPPQSTKTTPRAPQDPPETLRENLVCFGCLADSPKDPLGPPEDPPKTSKDSQRHPEGRPRICQGPPEDPPRTLQAIPRKPKDFPRTLAGPPMTCI